MEILSCHFDHTTKRSVLGYHNGAKSFPIDMAFHCSSNRPNQRIRDIDKRTNGWRRCTESLKKKIEAFEILTYYARRWVIEIFFCLSQMGSSIGHY